jgi:hypothetical protein
LKYLLTLALMMLIVGSANAARFDVDAKIGKIRHHEISNDISTAWQGGIWFTMSQPSLNGASPSCATDYSEYTLAFSPTDKNLLSILLSAKMANKEVTLTFDDGIKLNGKCKLQYLTIK